MAKSRRILAHSTQMILALLGAFFVATFFIGAMVGINWEEEISAVINPASYQLSPNQNYCVMAGRERYFRKPGVTRPYAPCFVVVQNGEGISRHVTIKFLAEYKPDELNQDLPSATGKYSVWRRKIYNGEVEQTRIFAGTPRDLVDRGAITDSTDNPGYMAYFIVPDETARQCGDNVDLSICNKLVLGEVLWW